MNDFLELVVSASASGCIYALVALSYLLITRPTGIINFAVGEWSMLAAIGGFLALSLMVRAEFSNIFNRTEMNDPGGANPTAAVTCSAGASNSPICLNSDTRGTLTGGFGFISTSTVASPPRTGTLVARFTF